MRIFLGILMAMVLVACYSNYAVSPDSPTASVTLIGPADAGVEMFTYEEGCGEISAESKPRRLGGAGPLKPTSNFEIEAERPLLIGVSLSNAHSSDACILGYELVFDAGAKYTMSSFLRFVERVDKDSSLYECRLEITPPPRREKSFKATGGLLPRPVC